MNEEVKPVAIRALFLDIGGVLLTNGWGHESRELAAKKFGLDYAEMQDRHQMTFDTYEMDRMSFDDYLKWTVFYEPRTFSKQEFIAFMYTQSQALDGNVEFFKALKNAQGLKVIAVSNEGRELNAYRIQAFGLDSLFDAYISSCYVGLHKPDVAMLKMACDVSHTQPSQALYIDDRPILVDVAKSFGLQTHHFQDLATTKSFLNTCTFYNPAK